MKRETQVQIAARLRDQTGLDVTRNCVREWKKQGWNLDDPKEVVANLRNQERKPKLIADNDKEEDEPKDYPEITSAQIPGEIAKLESDLINAPDYEEARTISTKLTGLKNAFKLHVEMGQYVTRESQEREGLMAGQVIKQLLSKIKSDLPQSLVGLEYPEVVKKCEDFENEILNEMSDMENLT
jgi:hypothetical protein